MFMIWYCAYVAFNFSSDHGFVCNAQEDFTTKFSCGHFNLLNVLDVFDDPSGSFSLICTYI